MMEITDQLTGIGWDTGNHRGTYFTSFGTYEVLVRERKLKGRLNATWKFIYKALGFNPEFFEVVCVIIGEDGTRIATVTSEDKGSDSEKAKWVKWMKNAVKEVRN